MKRLDPFARHTTQLTHLHAHALVFGDHVRLYDNSHILFEGKRLRRPGTRSPRAQDGRQVATSVTMYQVIVDAISSSMDVLSSIEHIIDRRSGANHARDAVVCFNSLIVETPVCRCGRRSDGKGAQDLTRVAHHILSADLGNEHIALLEGTIRGGLRRHAAGVRLHGRGGPDGYVSF